MSYKDFHRARWNSLAQEFGGTKPLGAVIAGNSDQINYYFDKISKTVLNGSLRFQHKRVLDLGCGVGRLSVWMASRAQHVTGVDISEEMIRVAQNLAAAQRVRNATFRVYDGTTLPYGNSSFDVIVCVGVLKYIIEDQDFVNVIGEMCRTVVPRGQIAIIDELDYAGPVKLAEEDLGGLSVLRRPTEYISLFEKHGMEMVDQCSIYRKRLSKRGDRILARLPLGHRMAARPMVARAMAMVDARIDEILRHRMAPTRGFQLLTFVRCS
jgi:SAM-dependent methyltransferase